MSHSVRAKMHCHEIVLRRRQAVRPGFKNVQDPETQKYGWVDPEGNPVTHENAYHFWNQPEVHMSTVISGSPENEVFYEASPGGKFEITINNPHAAEMFEVGRQYYFDITVAD